MPIHSINPNLIDVPTPATTSLNTPDVKGPSFKDTLGNLVNDTNRLLQKSDKASQDMAVGNAENIHEAMVAMEKAETAFKLMVQVRNKALDAYNEVMRMQV